jgi:hypothetical protein
MELTKFNIFPQKIGSKSCKFLACYMKAFPTNLLHGGFLEGVYEIELDTKTEYERF